jgi:hypothetical protein
MKSTKFIETAKNLINNRTKVFPATHNLSYNYSQQQEPVTVVYTCSGRRY